MLGCEVIGRFDPPGLAFLRLGQVRLVLDGNAPSALIYLRVADVRAATDKLRASGVPVESAPHLIHTDADGAFGPPGWQEWMAFIRDTEGNLIGLASQHAPD